MKRRKREITKKNARHVSTPYRTRCSWTAKHRDYECMRCGKVLIASRESH